MSQDTKHPRITGNSPLPPSGQKWCRMPHDDIGDIWHTAYVFKPISFSMGTVHRSGSGSGSVEALLLFLLFLGLG